MGVYLCVLVASPDLCPWLSCPVTVCPVKWSRLAPVTPLLQGCFGQHWSSHSGQSEDITGWLGAGLMGTCQCPYRCLISCLSRVLGSVGGPTPLVSWDRPSVGGDEVPAAPAPLLTRLAQVSLFRPLNTRRLLPLAPSLHDHPFAPST